MELIKSILTIEEREAYWEPLSLGEHLKLWAESYGSNTALVTRESRLTFRELSYLSDRMAAGLISIGIKTSDKVVIQLPNSINFVIVSFSLFRIGAIPIYVLPAHRMAELDAIFSMVNPAAYICTDSYMGFDYSLLAHQLREKYKNLDNVICDSSVKNGWSNKLDGLFLAPVNHPFPDYKSTALLLLSGGTTSVPKLIPRTHGDYAYNAKMCGERSGLDSSSVYLATLSIAHNFALCCPGVLGTLSQGGTVVLASSPDVREAFELIESHQVTITSLVPTLVDIWLDIVKWKLFDISSLQVLQVGGARFSSDAAMKINELLECKLQQVYGMAEGLICMTSLCDPDEVVHFTQGMPISPGDKILVWSDGGEVSPGGIGELLTKGPYTLQGYFMDEEHSKNVFTDDGYFCTGDLARICEDGNIIIEGRVKEQIQRGGEKISSSEIERYLLGHPDIREVAVVAAKDSKLGEVPYAYLVCINPLINERDIVDYLVEQGVSSYKIPAYFDFIEKIPTTAIGKVDRRLLTNSAKQSSMQKVQE